MKTKITHREILRLSIPIIVGSITENIITLTDTIFMGRVGIVALGAAAIGGMFYMAFVMIGMGLSTGTQILIARRKGEGDIPAIGKTFYNATFLILASAIVLFSFAKIFELNFLHRFIQSEAVWQASRQYIDIRLFTLGFTFCNILIRSFYTGISDTFIIALSSIIAAVLNIIFNYILVFGKLGFPAMGIKGSAIGSLLAEGIATIVYFSYTYIKRYHQRYAFFSTKKPDRDMAKKIMQLSSPMMVQYFISFGSWFVFFLIIEKMGELPLAVSNVVRSIYFIFLLPVWGFAVTANTLVSNKIGSGGTDEVMSLVYKIIRLSVGSALLIVILMNVFSGPLLKLYSDNQIVREQSFMVMQVLNVSAVLIAGGIVLLFSIAGTGNTKMKFLVETSVVSLYLLYTIIMVKFFNPGIITVWCVEIIYGACLILFSYLYLSSGRWKHKKI